MQAAEYAAISRYLLYGDLPESFESTRSNFTRKARLFTVHGGALHRHGLPVVKFSQRRSIFDQFHEHRGRDHGFATEINILGARFSKAYESRMAMISARNWFERDISGRVGINTSLKKPKAVWHALTKSQSSNIMEIF